MDIDRFYFLGGQEESLLRSMDIKAEESAAEPDEVRSRTHAYVTTFRRNRNNVRKEIVQASRNFLQVRYHTQN